MTRSLIPPRGIFVPTSILFDLSLTPTVRDTAAQLLALSWGLPETPPITFEKLQEITGKSVPTLYGHLRLLRIRGVLRWRSGGSSTFIFSLKMDIACAETMQINDETVLANSKKQETPDNSLNPKINFNQDVKTSDSDILENDNPPKTSTLIIKNKYCELLGYIPHNWAEGEGAAAKAIAEHFTVTEFEQVYRHMKTQLFWQDKHLMLRQVKPQMQGVLAYLSKNGNGKATQNGTGRQTSGPTIGADETTEQREHNRQIQIAIDKKASERAERVKAATGRRV